MSVKKLDKKALDSWVESLVAGQKVFGVQAKGERFAFAELADASALRLDYDVTMLPPKKYFLPQEEDLLTFKRSGEHKSVIECDPFVLLGVHPYDFVGIRQMDAIFAKDNDDIHYQARRKAATIVVCDVQNASENVFAGCMNSAVVEDGFDVLITKIGESYLLDAKTEKGEALLKSVDAPDAAEADLAERSKVWEANKAALKKHDLKCAPADLPKLLGSSEEHPVWAEKAEKCFSCGSCNLVCPTCYCFDVQDTIDWDMDSGKRYRCWDGCMLKDFATVTGNHNFRPKAEDRYRHRYYRKGKYIPEKIGEISCVGCGRCITACVAKIANPVEIYNRLLEGK